MGRGHCRVGARRLAGALKTNLLRWPGNSNCEQAAYNAVQTKARREVATALRE
jgi:hypothetical protein